MKKSFTIIELVVVIAIIGILMSAAIGTYYDLAEKRTNSVAQSELKTVSLAVALFNEKTGELPLGDIGTVITKDNLLDFYEYMHDRDGVGEGNGIDNPMYFFAINFDKLTKPYTDASGHTLAPLISNTPKTSYYSNAAKGEINHSKTQKAFIYVIDKNLITYIADNDTDMNLYGINEQNDISILDGTKNK